MTGRPSQEWRLDGVTDSVSVDSPRVTGAPRSGCVRFVVSDSVPLSAAGLALSVLFAAELPVEPLVLFGVEFPVEPFDLCGVESPVEPLVLFGVEFPVEPFDLCGVEFPVEPLDGFGLEFPVAPLVLFGLELSVVEPLSC